MDITPLIPKGKQIITGYGDGGFKINNERIEGSVLVFPDRTESWTGALNDFAALLANEEAIELLLIGTGKSMQILDPAIRQSLKAKGMNVEVMDTGAACRTYNVLMSEDRRVAAALIAV